jgi:FKBP-type peptidyl-prolyl cis-trans isomerase FklB
MSDKLKDASYCIGMSVAGSLMGQNLGNIDPQRFLKGLTDVMDQHELEFDAQRANEIIQDYLEEVTTQQFVKFKEEGEAFLANNVQRSEIQVTASGLQYEILEIGEGRIPGPSDRVTVHYHGTLIDGTVFDSSLQRGTPATFGVNQVIKGWTEALQMMKEGAKYRLYIPQDLGYGANPHPGGAIKPYMALIFDVELIQID